MGRLSKANLADRGRYVFKQEEVKLPEIPDDEGEPGTVLVRTPSVGMRDALAKKLPDKQSDWTLEHTALLFSTIVVDPSLMAEEAKEFLEDWPDPALQRIAGKWSELIGSEEDMREAAGDFRPTDGETT